MVAPKVVPTNHNLKMQLDLVGPSSSKDLEEARKNNGAIHRSSKYLPTALSGINYTASG